MCYRIYSIKRPGVYFISKSVKGAFKRGRLLNILLWVYVIVIVHYIRIYGSKPPRTRAKPRGQGSSSEVYCHQF